MQLGYWGCIWVTTRPQNIMVSKMNTISLVTVEVGNLRLVWRFSGIGGPRLLPPLHLAALLLPWHCHCLQGRSSLPLHRPFSLKEGEKKGRRWHSSPLQGKDPEVTHLISTHFPLARIQSHNHILLQESWEMQSQACVGIRPVASSLTVEKRGWSTWREDEVEGQLTLSSIICMWNAVWRMVHSNRNIPTFRALLSKQ